MEDAEHQHDGRFDPIGHEIWRSDNREFPGARDASGPANRGVCGQPRHGVMDGVPDVDRSPRITLANPIDLRGQGAGNIREPLDGHALRPVARPSQAERCCCQLERTAS